MKDRHKSELGTNKRKDWFRRLQADCEDIGLVDRVSGGYELVMDEGSKRFKTVKELRIFIHAERVRRIDKPVMMSELKQKVSDLEQQLKDIKKDCVLAKYAAVSDRYNLGQMEFAVYILKEHFQER